MNVLRKFWHSIQPGHFPITYKLALLITLSITLGMGLLGMMITNSQFRLLQQQMNSFGTALVLQMAGATKEPLLSGDTLTLNLLSGSMLQQGNVRGAVIYNDELEPLSAIGQVPDTSHVLRSIRAAGDDWPVLLQDWQASVFGQATDTTLFLAPVKTRDLQIGYVLLSIDHLQLKQAQDATLHAVTTATLLMILLGGLISIWAGRRISRPVNRLADASMKIFQGNYEQRFDERRNDEIGTLMQAFNLMSNGLQRKNHVERLFSMYVSPKVAHEALKNTDQIRLGGEPVEASVLFADIAGFTALGEQLAPAMLSELLNEYFNVIALAAQACSGHVDKYIGDCAMLVFGAPARDETHSLNAVRCAVLIQHLITELNSRRSTTGEIPLQFHISCNSGPMLAGNMGAQDRMEYTVLGDAVNLASRLSAIAEPGQILISTAMAEPLLGQGHILARENNTVLLRGKEKPVSTMEVLGLTIFLHNQMLQQARQILAHPFSLQARS